MTDIFETVSPVDGSVYVQRPRATAADLDTALARAAQSQKEWRRLSVDERAGVVERFVDAVVARGDTLAEELTWQMGRPIRYGPLEIKGFAERGYGMVKTAKEALSDIEVSEKEGFSRFIRREPLGVVLVLAPWNYPWLTAVNAIVPALMAGNSVVVKHSGQTPLVSERLDEAANEAGLHGGVFQYLHMSHELVARAVDDARVDYVAFTGSVEGGRAVHRAAARRFIACGLELGGKDPAYVCPDAPMAHAVESLVDGAFFNSGQSCCGIERIYAHKDVYDDFVERFAALVGEYRLGDPTDPETTLGPVARPSSALAIKAQVDAAIAQGATALIDEKRFLSAKRGFPYMAPQVLVDVTHDMQVMREETFGPVVGIQRVADEEEAVQLMNDSRYGLTASIWTRDLERAMRIGDRVETGTWFMNRCDYLDPELAWVGIKDSGRGCTLSRVGYEHLTRPKSFHLRHAPTE